MERWKPFESQLEGIKELVANRNGTGEMGAREVQLRREMTDEVAERFFDDLVSELTGKFSRRWYQLCEEGVQEALVILFRKLEQLRSGSWKEVKGWLRTTARNLVWKEIKDQKKRLQERTLLRDLLEEVELNQGDAIAEGQLGQEMARKLEWLLHSEKLTRREQELLALVLEDCSPSQIREILHISGGNLRQIRLRLREKVKRFLQRAA